MNTLLLALEPTDRNSILSLIVICILVIQLYIDAKKSQLKLFKLFRKESFESLQAKLLSLEETINPIIAISEDGIIISANKAATYLFGWEEEGLIRKNVKVLVPDRYIKVHEQGLKEYKENKENKIINKTVQLVAKKRDGKEIPISLTVKKVEDNDKTIFVGILKDISDEKELAYIHAEQIRFFKDSLSMYEEMESVGSVGGWVWDIKKELVSTTKGFRTIFGTPANEAPMEYFTRRVYEKDQPIVRKGLDDAFDKKEYHINYRVIRPIDNTVAFVECYGRPKLDEDKIVTHIYGMIKLIKLTKYEDAGFS